METANKNQAKRSPLIRITAAVLAVIMILSVILYQQSGVTLKAEDFETKGARIAARQLLKGDDYANASTLKRMTTLARSLIRGKHTIEELETGVQVAVAQANYDEAITLTKKIMDQYEGDEQGVGGYCLRLGYLYVMKNDAENALKWLNSGIEYAPTPEAHVVRAQVLLSMDRIQESLEDVNVYMETAENPEDLMPDLINVYEVAGEYETAVSLYTRLIDLSGDPEYLLNRAYCRTNMNQMETAQADRDEYAAAGGRELASADVMIGLGWMRRNDYKNAGDSFARAIDENYADPNSVYYYVVLCAYVNEDYERVCKYGDQLIDRLLKGESMENASYTVEKTTGRLNVTLAQMDVSSLCLMTGASHVQLESYDQAAESLTACLKADQGVVYANYLRGTCYLVAERYEEAISDFDISIAAGEEVERSRYGRGVCRMETGDKAGAIEDFEWVVFNGQDEELFNEASLLITQLLNEGSKPEETETETQTQTETQTETSGD